MHRPRRLVKQRPSRWVNVALSFSCPTYPTYTGSGHSQTRHYFLYWPHLCTLYLLSTRSISYHLLRHPVDAVESSSLAWLALVAISSSPLLLCWAPVLSLPF